jgi:gliding motility-associated-like protein
MSTGALAQGTTCADADPFCTGTTYSFPNNTGTSAQTGPDYGCLVTQPNPAWYYLQIDQSGTIQMDISQVNASGSGIDVDFITYGPFGSAAAGCGALTAGNIVDCSYSSSANETATITGAVSGEYYIVLITNYSNQAGNISFSQTGGTGSTDCSIVVPTCPTVGFHVESAGAIVDLPISMDCNVDGWVFLRHDDVATAGGLLTPTVTVNIATNGETAGNNIYGYENNGGTWNNYWSSQNIPSNTNFSFTMYEMDNVTATSFGVEMCDVNSGSDMSYTIVDDNCGTTIAAGTWGASDGSNSGSSGPNGNPTSGGCSFVSFAPGQVSGSAVYTCPTCPPASFVTTDFGFAYFNPAQAGPGTYDITYCFDNGCGCSGCQTEQITVVNPYDASFTYSASTYCQYDADPTASITGDAGGIFTSAPAGLSLNSASGAIDVSSSTPGSYVVSYAVGSGAIDYSGSCNDVVDASITIGEAPTAGAGSNEVIDCFNPSVALNGTGIGNYSWVASGGGNILTGSNTATPTVDAAGTYTLIVTNSSGCENSDIVTVSEDITPPTVGSSATAIIDCNNTSTTVTAVGGLTYSWVASPGGNITSGAGSATATVDAAGSYTVTVTGANGCTATDVAIVTDDIIAPIADAGSAGVIDCNNSTINLLATGGGTYSWIASGGGNITVGLNSANPTVNAAGSYAVTVTGANGCTDTDITIVTTDLTPPTADAGSDGAIDCTVSAADLIATGGGTYSWVASSGGNITSGANSATMTGNAAGTYTVTVAGANGCTDTDVAVITSNVTVPTADAGSDQTLDCNNATVNMTATGGGTYAWVATGGGNITSGASSATIAADANGTYTVTVTATSGCTSTDAVQVTTSPTPTVSVSGGGTICAGDLIPDVIINLTGSAPWTVTYNDGSSNITVNPATSPFIISGGIDGAYTIVSASDATTCPATISGSAIITTNPLPVSVLTGGGTICATDPIPDITITFTGTAPWNITYELDGLPASIVSNISPYTISGGADGNYVITSVSDANCLGTSNGTANITTNPLPTATISGGGTICAGDPIPDITIVLTGTGPWSGNYFDGTNTIPFSTNTSTFIIQNGADGTYTVSNVSDVNCVGVAIDVATITTSPLPTANVTGGGIICAGDAIQDVIFTLTGTGPWSLTYTDGVTPSTIVVNSSPFILSNASDGTYSVTALSDATACSGTSFIGSATVLTNALPTATVSGGGTICSGAAIPDITITLTGTGPWDLTYTDGLTPVTVTANTSPYVIANGADGTYSVTAINDANCTGTASGSGTILSNLVPLAPVSGTSTVYCFGDPIADLFAVGTGGVLTWYSDLGFTTIGAGTSYSPTNAVGIYTFYVSEESNGCTGPLSSIDIVINDVPVIDSEIAVDVSGCNITDGTITINASGGTPPYNYSIDGGLTFTNTTGIFTGLDVNSYQVVVSDVNCETVGSLLVVSGPGIPAAPVAGTDATYCDGDAILDLTATSASGGTLAWYDDAALTNFLGSNPTFTPSNMVGATTYYVTETVTNCQSPSTQITIIINPTPSAPVASGGNTYCEGDLIVDLTAVPSIGGTMNWYDDAGLTNLVGTGFVFTPVNAVGTFAYYVLESLNGCTGPATQIDVIIRPTPVFTVIDSNPSTCSGSDGELLITGLVPGNTYTITYSENGTPNIPITTAADINGEILISNLIAGIFTFVTVELNGCSSTDVNTFTLIDPPMPDFTVIANNPTSCGGFDGSLVLSGLDPSTNYDINYNDDTAPMSASMMSDGSGEIIIGGLDAGVYADVSVTLSGCNTTLAGPYNLIDPNAPIFSIGATVNPSGCGISDASITINGLTPSTTYNLTYNLNGVPVGPISVTSDSNGDYVISGIPGGTYDGITIELAGCTSTDLYSGVLAPIYPTAPIAFTDSTYCEGDPIADLNGISAFGGTMTWYNDAGLTSQVGAGSVYTVLDTAPGIYTYYVTETLSNCEGPSSVVTVIISPIPAAPVISGDVDYCEGDAVANLSVTPQGTGTVTWYSDVSLTDSIGTGPTFTPATGVDTVTYYVVETVNNCESSISNITVTIYPNPVAGFEPTPSSGNIPLDVYFDNTSSGADAYAWNFGDGTTSTEFDPSNTFTETGDYSISLYIVDSYGCIDSASVEIIVEGLSTLIIPNIFTPNGDGSNDVFNLTGTNIIEIKGTIMNRWGQIVYQFNTLEAGWTGRTVSGIEAAEGTYYYFIDAFGADGQEYNYQGPFELIR